MQIRRPGRLLLYGGGFCLLLIALVGPQLSPHDPMLPAGMPFLPPNMKHPFGTDSVGRDVLSRVLFGLRSTIGAAVVVIASGIIIGSLVGLISGMGGQLLDAVLMRVTDAFLALPGPLIAIAVVGTLGPSLNHTVIALVVVWWPLYARIIRGEVRAFLVRPAYESARMTGIGKTRLALRHLMPGIVPPIIIAASLDVGLLVLSLTGLSFLGLGSPPPAPELGAMSARELPYLLQHWWSPVMPAIAIFFLALISNLLGDDIRDMLRDK
jgi:ABC-type dipeptide/oligopeptide/nickel transport system permease subunit